jgi:hypothetical protein
VSPIPFADNFLAGSIISLVLPVSLLIAIAIWYWVAVRRVPDTTAKPLPPVTQASDQPGVDGPDPAPPAPGA